MKIHDPSEVKDAELTPEMIKAGTNVLSGYDPRFDMPEDIVAEIYLKMKCEKSSS